MKINMNTMNDPAWVAYPESPGVLILIRPLTASRRAELQKQATTDKIKMVKGRRMSAPDLDMAEYEKRLRAHVIKDWKGIEDPDGNPIPCTDENRTAIIDHLNDLRIWAVNTAIDLELIRNEQQADDSQD